MTLGVIETLVPIQPLHVAKVSVSDADDYDRDRQMDVGAYQVHCGVHIMDLSIGQNQKYLVTTGTLVATDFSQLEGLGHKRMEESWPCKFNTGESLGV